MLNDPITCEKDTFRDLMIAFVFRNVVWRADQHDSIAVVSVRVDIGAGRGGELPGHVGRGHVEEDAERHQLLHRQLSFSRYSHRIVRGTISSK